MKKINNKFAFLSIVFLAIAYACMSNAYAMEAGRAEMVVNFGTRLVTFPTIDSNTLVNNESIHIEAAEQVTYQWDQLTSAEAATVTSAYAALLSADSSSANITSARNNYILSIPDLPDYNAGWNTFSQDHKPSNIGTVDANNLPPKFALWFRNYDSTANETEYQVLIVDAVNVDVSVNSTSTVDYTGNTIINTPLTLSSPITAKTGRNLTDYTFQYQYVELTTEENISIVNIYQDADDCNAYLDNPTGTVICEASDLQQYGINLINALPDFDSTWNNVDTDYLTLFDKPVYNKSGSYILYIKITDALGNIKYAYSYVSKGNIEETIATEYLNRFNNYPNIRKVLLETEGEVLVRNFTDNQLGAFILTYANATAKNTTTICDTEYENDLLELGIISANGTYTCSNITTITLANMRTIAKYIFGDDYNFTPSNSQSANSPFYYYGAANIGIFRYGSDSTIGELELGDFSFENENAYIEMITNDEEPVHYSLNFLRGTDSYYISGLTGPSSNNPDTSDSILLIGIGILVLTTTMIIGYNKRKALN